MTSFKARFSDFISLIQMKQEACKAKFKTYRNILSLGRQTQLKKVEFQFSTISELFKHLVTINVKQLTGILILSLAGLFLRLFFATFNTFLIQFYLGQKALANLIQSILILVAYKLVKNWVDQWSSYLQMNYGYKGYSSLYYHFISSKKQMTGQVLNIIQDDMEQIANLPYSLINFPFQAILVIVLTIMLASSLNQNQAITVSILLIAFLVSCVSGVVIFKLNGVIMKQKDFRLSLNLSRYQNVQDIQDARRKQVSLIKIILIVKLAVKWFNQVCFVLLYTFCFLWRPESQSFQDNQLYYRLMLLGMIKAQLNSLFAESYYIALILNSLKRIIRCQNRQSIQKSTIGDIQDFLKRNDKGLPKTQSQRQSSNSSVNNQSLMDQSLLHSNQRLSNQKSRESIEIKEIKLNKQKDDRSKRNKKRYTQKGQIKIFQLLKYINQNVSPLLILAMVFLAIFTLYSKFQYLRISNSILHNKLTSYETFIFILPSFLYTLLYLTIIFIFIQVSHNLFRNLSSDQIQGQDLNRISGDIEKVDKYVSPSFYEFMIAIFGLLASLAVSISLIGDIWLTILTTVLIVVIIYLSGYFNRYFMKSRRQIKRLQCKMKSQIIQVYAQHIATCEDKQIDFRKVQKKWKRINMCKNMGIAIENSYIVLLNVLVLIIQVICLIVCHASQIDNHTMKLILVFILQIDLSLTSLFLNGISQLLEMSQFCKKKNNYIKNIKLREHLADQIESNKLVRINKSTSQQMNLFTQRIY